MGNVCTGGSGSDGTNNEIDKKIKSDRSRLSNEVKLLLLGAGESGKSTILKQMKILHQGGYNESERESYREIIWSNTIQSMQVLLRGMKTLNPSIEFDDPAMEKKGEIILGLSSQGEDFVFTSDIAKNIKELWNNPAILATFDRSSELQLNDSAKYYFDSLDRLALSDYLPTEQDVLRSRVKTTGISETNFNVRDVTFRVFDVGGQRSERRKWIHCFEGVTAIMFCVALSEYDLVLREDETQNRMQEALQLFDSICNSRWFTETSIILFLNKTDLFREKVMKVPLSQCFPEYVGGHDYTVGSEFIKEKFTELNRSPEKKTIYPHNTCATDTENMKFVWAAVNDIVTRTSLRKAGLM
eukprot:Lithocolla_globosa_v1_NODE_4378_length_1450_cov_119.556272.p1 type:complete len:356 gc:universal NODE_4378_length_1450_cov_119.556272:1284-217(-)